MASRHGVANRATHSFALRTNGARLLNPAGEVRPPTSLSGVAMDRQLRQLVESLSDYAILMLDPDGLILSWNRGAELIKGYTAAEIVGRHFSAFYTPQAVAVGHPDNELSAARASGRYCEDGWRLRQDGGRFWAHVVITAMYDDNGVLIGYGMVTHDLTAHKQSEEQAANTLSLLRKTARTDPLTGVYNRRALDEGLTAQIQTGQAFSIAMIDIDDFKAINDEIGHAGGDQMLRRAATAWSGCLREQDMLARYGGDEFIVVLPGCSLPDALLAAERLCNAMAEPTCSIGVAVWEQGMNSDDLVGHADAALYSRKALRTAPGRPQGRQLTA